MTAGGQRRTAWERARPHLDGAEARAAPSYCALAGHPRGGAGSVSRVVRRETRLRGDCSHAGGMRSVWGSGSVALQHSRLSPRATPLPRMKMLGCTLGPRIREFWSSPEGGRDLNLSTARPVPPLLELTALPPLAARVLRRRLLSLAAGEMPCRSLCTAPPGTGPACSVTGLRAGTGLTSLPACSCAPDSTSPFQSAKGTRWPLVEYLPLRGLATK